MDKPSETHTGFQKHMVHAFTNMSAPVTTVDKTKIDCSGRINFGFSFSKIVVFSNK